MQSHHMTIAKASFAASCLRPDVTQLTREEISRFHTLLGNTISRCTHMNIQTCKNWLSEHILPSPQRTHALAKYLTSCAKYLDSKDDPGASASSIARKRLHVLYILHDILHHAKYHVGDKSIEANLYDGFRPHLQELFRCVGIDCGKRVERRLAQLRAVWEQENYFETQTLTELDNVPIGLDAEKSYSNAKSSTPIQRKEVPFVMPAMHGDPTTPYYDLPAANLMPHIHPNQSVPMRPDQIRALQLSAGPADESLVNSVRDFLKDIDKLHNPYQALEDDGVAADMDELGQLSYLNEADELVGDTYYGWSRDFCIKVKKRGNEDNAHTNLRSQAAQNRKYSSSRSSSLSRSPSGPFRRGQRNSSRSRSPKERQAYRSRSRSLSPNGRPAGMGYDQHNRNGYPAATYPGLMISSDMAHPYTSLDSSGMPIPPPRPHNYTGPWPPPPPPPPPPPVGPSGFAFPVTPQSQLDYSGTMQFRASNAKH